MKNVYDIEVNDKVGKLADELGLLNAQIADLQTEAKEVKAAIIESGYDSIDGEGYTATVVRSERKVVGWQKIAKDLGASVQKIAANTKLTPSVAVRIVGKSAEVKAA